MITGLSGGGRSQAADILEDLGWFVIDNLPPSLIPKVSELAQAPGSSISKVALVVGSGPYHEEVLPALEALRRHVMRLRILFLEASTDVLVRRYESSRRRHPLDDGRPRACPTRSRPSESDSSAVKDRADVVVDTSELNVHQLRDRLLALFGDDTADAGMQTTIMSFGYKHGLPLDTDLVIDCRFLPNPHWVDELRPLRGTDPAGAGLRDGPTGHGRVPRGPVGPAASAVARLHRRGQELPDRGVRLHRWTSPVGRHRRGDRSPACRTTATNPRSSTATSNGDRDHRIAVARRRRPRRTGATSSCSS